ncbi:MAG: proton-conducting transporter membrane subunit [Desulfatiglandaceae bacterium]
MVAALLIVVPLGLAFAMPLFSFVSKRIAGYIPIAAMLCNLILSILLLPSVMENPQIVVLGGLSPPLGIHLVAGPLGVGLSGLISLVGLAVSIYAWGYIKQGAQDKYHALYLLLLSGATGAVLTGDLFNLFVFYEILCISSYALVAYLGDRNGVESAVKYLIQGSVGSGLILVGIAILYGMFGTLNMAQIAIHIKDVDSPAIFLALVFLVTGFGVEAAVFPLNAWLPDAHSTAPSSISAILSGIAIKVGIYAVARVLFTIFGVAAAFQYVLFLGLVTLLVGEICAFSQDNIKRMLAYSSVGQVGLIVFAICIATPDGVGAGLFQLVSHALSKAVLFLGVGYLVACSGSMSLSSLNGIGKRMPVVCFACVVAAFSLVGLPPFAGFAGKFLIVRAALAGEGIFFTVLIGIVLLATVVEGAYFFRMVQTLYFKDAKKQIEFKKTPASASIPILALVVLIVALGVYPDVLLPYLESAAADLLNKAGYIKEVLG